MISIFYLNTPKTRTVWRTDWLNQPSLTCLVRIRAIEAKNEVRLPKKRFYTSKRTAQYFLHYYENTVIV